MFNESSIMSECSLPLYIQQLCDFDHRKFLDTLQFNDSSENNIKTLIKITNHYRQVIPIHIAASKSIQTRYFLLKEKYKYHKLNIKEIENEMTNLIKKSDHLSNKVVEAKEKQHELMNRVLNVRSSLNNFNNDMSYAEIQSLQVLADIKEKIQSFKNEINNINSKVDDMKSHNDQIVNNRFYFQDWQINLARNNLILMNDSIQKLLDDLIKMRETVDQDLQ